MTEALKLENDKPFWWAKDSDRYAPDIREELRIVKQRVYTGFHQSDGLGNEAKRSIFVTRCLYRANASKM
ncbi:hypothetical protein [Crocosphaera watsonii]|uniref:Uncharacterized protein n=2 Tax=Crocosphaera watsonii TaxID=263511 RepID=G5JDY3_CROWT|nr:hypothetical protein [Crocosphaera watsonii]EHJ09596.1 hypothetical protein CWATWH0003_5622 [Crocosphaera watsonii WH 0003]CCQ53741.1 hypothetical protein CWATWH0005_3894 [Crocosphaera watsonii WH 0005]